MSPQNPRQSTSSSGSRSSNPLSNPNVFSDEYALEPLENHDNSSFHADDNPTSSSAHPCEHDATGTGRPLSPEPISPVSTLPLSTANKPFGGRDVVGQAPKRAISRASNAISDVHRASSTSSHFSAPRSQSPYTGATGPSHPYGMYPQITRTSSVASASTVRPAERSFVAPSGPEHPYAMYSQNTVPEEDVLSLGAPTIPLGFPGMGQQYQRGPRMRRDDIGDIVGSDGHIEQLPPYTRYPDGGAAKDRPQSLRAMTLPAVMPGETPISAPISHAHSSDDGAVLNTAASGNSGSESSGSLKEKMKQKSKQRICGGLPFWCIFVIIGVLLVGVVIGGVIGGVVARRKGNLANAAAAGTLHNSSVPITTVTSTAFIDGAPLPTDHPVPHVPNGSFRVPTDDLAVSSPHCIEDESLSNTWICMPPMGVGFAIEGQGWNAELTLDPYPYPVNSTFTYGAQPPNLNLKRLRLAPSIDKDSNELGITLFASDYYDKLTILHEEDLQPNGHYKHKRGRDRQHARTGDKPWFCWFNNTVLQIFIYVNKPLESAALADAETPSPGLEVPSSFTTLVSATATPGTPTITSVAENPPMQTRFPTATFAQDSSTIFGYRKKRDPHLGRRQTTFYPRVVKIEEKREPNGNIQPYCEQMQILNNWEIVPRDAISRIPVREVGSEETSPFVSRRLGRRGDDFHLHQTCACEWISDR